VHLSTFAIVGSAAFLGGYTRLTYSLAVIMMETTESVNLFLPIIFSLFVAYGSGSIFNKSLYAGMLRSKNIPLLQKKVPKCNKNLRATTLSAAPVVTLDCVSSMKDITRHLKYTTHNGFPVINSQGNLVGLIARNTLMALISKKCWYNHSNLAESDD
jgi:chloride channel 7